MLTLNARIYFQCCDSLSYTSCQCATAMPTGTLASGICIKRNIGEFALIQNLYNLIWVVYNLSLVAIATTIFLTDGAVRYLTVLRVVAFQSAMAYLSSWIRVQKLTTTILNSEDTFVSPEPLWLILDGQLVVIYMPEIITF